MIQKGLRGIKTSDVLGSPAQQPAQQSDTELRYMADLQGMQNNIQSLNSTINRIGVNIGKGVISALTQEFNKFSKKFFGQLEDQSGKLSGMGDLQSKQTAELTSLKTVLESQGSVLNGLHKTVTSLPKHVQGKVDSAMVLHNSFLEHAVATLQRSQTQGFAALTDSTRQLQLDVRKLQGRIDTAIEYQATSEALDRLTNAFKQMGTDHDQKTKIKELQAQVTAAEAWFKKGNIEVAKLRRELDDAQKGLGDLGKKRLAHWSEEFNKLNEEKTGLQFKMQKLSIIQI